MIFYKVVLDVKSLRTTDVGFLCLILTQFAENDNITISIYHEGIIVDMAFI